jgi:uncharacterized protein YhhL (DUF1145 family)
MRKLFGAIGAFLQTPTGVILTTNAFWHIVLLALDIPFNYIISGVMLVLDVFLAIMLRDQLIYFFSQFVLPIQNPKDRRDLAARVSNFETGRRGPALFVKNGRVITHEGEQDKRGAGVILLDTASALVLRTDTEIRDTVGPGIKFTHDDEYIAGSVDLRTQWQFIGPLASDQTLLASVPPKTDKNLQNRAQQTAGLTRDGFELSAAISIKFGIKRPLYKMPDESGVISQYGFDPLAVHNAITREVVMLNATDNKQTRMEWNRLPAHLVVNLWREYIRKFKLGDLFTNNGISGLQTIEEMINKRVRQANVVALDDTGLPTGEWIDSLEYNQLESRGLEITEVRIHNVLLDQSIEAPMIESWSAEWLNLAKKEEALLKEREALIETAAREEASKKFALIASEKIGNKPTMPQQTPFKTLQLLIEPLRDFIIKESSASNDMEKELRKLDEIWKWLLENNPDGAASQARRRP